MVSIRIWIRTQLFTSMRIRIQEAKDNEDPDSDPSQTLTLQKAEFFMKNILHVPCVTVGNLVDFLAPGPESGSAFLKQIRIQESQIHADPALAPDPQNKKIPHTVSNFKKLALSCTTPLGSLEARTIL
jgi:hypothetical protein